MAVFKATKNKSTTGGVFKATKNRSYDTAVVRQWESDNKDSLSKLREYQQRVSSGGYLSREDLADYRNALDRYKESAASLRYVSARLGAKNDAREAASWETTLSGLESNYKGLSDFYSQWDTEEDYNFWQQNNTAEKRQKQYSDNQSRLEALRAEREGENARWGEVDPIEMGVESADYQNAQREHTGKMKAIDEEIAAIEAQMRQYERGLYDDQGRYYGTKTVDDYASVMELPEYAVSSQKRDYQNPTLEELKNINKLLDTSTWRIDDDGNYIASDGVMLESDGRGGYVHPALEQGTDVEDKLGWFLSMQGDGQAEGLATPANGNGTSVWYRVYSEGTNGSWNKLTDGEIGIYYTLLDTQGQDAAYQYLQDMTVELNRREMEGNIQGWREDYAEASAMEKILMNAATIPANVIGNIPGLISDAAAMARGDDINPYSFDHTGMHYTNTVRGQTASELDETGFKIPLVNFTLGDLYQSGMSIGDSLLAMGIGGKYGGVLLAAGAAENEAYKLYKQGASADQIALGAAAAGAAELVFESISLGELDKIKDMMQKAPKSFGQYIKTILIQGGVEASEEALTEVANTVSNAIIMGTQSDWEALVDSHGGNVGAALLEKTLDVIHSGIGGFVSGAGSGAVAGGTGYAKNVHARNTAAKTLEEKGIDKKTAKKIAQQMLETDEGHAVGDEPSAGKVDAEEGESDFEASAEGKTIRKDTGDPVQIQAVAAVDGKKMTLRLTDGSEVDASEIAYSNPGEAYVFETVASLGVDATEATRIVNGYRRSGVEGKAFADGVKIAFEYGYGNFSQQELTQKRLAGDIPQIYLDTAYEIGQKVREQEGVSGGTELGVQYSLREFGDGKRFVDVEADAHAFDGMTVADMNRAAKAILMERFAGKVIGIDNRAFVNGDSVNEYLHPSKSIDHDIRKAKLTAAGELDNLLDAGEALPNEADGKDGHVHPDAIDFSYYKTVFKVGNEYFEGIVNIKNIKRGKLLKDVTKIRNITKDIVSSYGQNPKSNFLRDASMDSIRNPGETVNKKVSGKAGGVYYTTKDGTAMTLERAEKKGKLALKEKQKVAVQTAQFLKKLGLGGNYYFFESYIDHRGKRVFKDRFGRIQTAPNGLYYSDGDIYIDINAGSDENSITLHTLSHELTHMVQQWSAAKYKVLADFLAEQYDKEGRNAYEAAKAKQAQLREIRGKDVPFQEAYHEFVADSMATLFDDGNMYDILTQMKGKDKGLVDYIKKFFDGLAEKVRKFYGGKQAQTDEGQFVQSLSEDTIYRLQELFADALVEASENYAASEQKNTDTEIGVKMMSRDQNQNVVVDESVDFATVKAILKQIYNGDYKSDNNYFPVLKNTPQVYMDYCHLDADRSFVMAKKKAYKAMQQKNKKQHALGDDGLMYVIENLGTPDYIVYQNVGEYAGNYAVIIISEEREIFAAVQLGEYKDAQYAPNGEKGYYNTLITAFYPNEGYLDNNIFIPENDIVYEKKEDPLQVASGVTPSDRAEESSNNRVSYPSGVVKKNSDRTNTPSNRALLAQALEGVVTDVEDFQAVQEYRRIAPLLDAEEAKLSRLNAEIREITFGKGKRDNDKLFALRLEAKQTQNRIDIYDKQLLELEATAPLKKVLEREKAKAYKRAVQKGKEAIRKEKERAQARYDELATKNTEARKKATEGRHKTAMRHKIQKVVKKLNDLLLNETKDKHIPSGLKKPVAEALDAIDMAMSDPAERIAELDRQIKNAKTPEQAAELGAKKAKLEDRAERFKEKVDGLKAAYDAIKGSPDMPTVAYDEVIAGKIQEVSELIGDTPLHDMSMAQLEAVYDMFTMLAKAVSNGNKTFKANRAQTISQLGAAVANEVTAAGGSHRLSIKGLDGIRTFDWNNLKPVYAFERIGSSTFTELFKNVRKGEDTWAVDMTEAREFYLEQSKKYGYDKWDMQKQYSFESTTGKEFRLTLEQIMSLYAYSKRDQAGDHLRKGGFVFDSAIEVTEKKHGIPVKYKVNTADAYNLSPEILSDIIGTLSEEQSGFVDAMQDYLSSVMGEKGNEVSMALYDVRLFKEKHYFPLRSAKQYMFEQNETAGEVRLKNSGFSKKTQPHASNPVILGNFMDVWAKHVNDMSMYHAFVLPLEDFNRVYNFNGGIGENTDTESVKGRIQNAYGAQANDYIKQLITDLNGGAVSDPRETPSKTLMSKFKKAAVMASLSVVVQQPTAIVRAMALVDAKHFGIAPITRGVVRTVNAKKHKAIWAEVKKYAPVAIIKEMGYFDTNMGRSSQEFIKAKAYSGIGEKAKAVFTDENYRDEKISRLPALADEMAWVAIWEAVKREVFSANPKLSPKSDAFLKLVGERFTEVVTKTQVYDSVLARSGNMRSKTAFMNMWTSFMAEPTTSINMLQDALRKGKKGDKRYAAKALGAVYGSVILNAAVVSLVYAMRDDDEDETFTEKYFARLITELLDGMNPLTYIPFAKDVWSIMQGFDIERADMSLVTDLAETLQKAVKLLATDTADMDAGALVEHQKKVADALWGIADTIASLAGIPVKNVRRDINGVCNLFATLAKDSEGRKTSAGSLLDKVLEAVKATTPIWGWMPDEGKGIKLYRAIVSGDAAYIERLRSGYKDEKTYIAALRKALRENDPRIKAAAQAVIDGNPAERIRISKQIIAEGRFSQDIVVAAINAEIDKLREAQKSK